MRVAVQQHPEEFIEPILLTNPVHFPISYYIVGCFKYEKLLSVETQITSLSFST